MLAASLRGNTEARTRARGLSCSCALPDDVFCRDGVCASPQQCSALQVHNDLSLLQAFAAQEGFLVDFIRNYNGKR